MSAWTRTLPLLLAVATTACPGPSVPPADKSPQAAPAPTQDPPAAERVAPVRDAQGDTSDAELRATIEKLRADPAFKDDEFRAAAAAPFVVFQEVDQQGVRDTIAAYDKRDRVLKEQVADGTAKPADVEQHLRWAEHAETLANRNAVLLAELDRRFREHFAERFELPTLAEKGRHPTVVVFWSLKTSVRAMKDSAVRNSPDVGDRAMPPRPDVTTHLVDAFLMSKDELLCADDRVQKAGDQMLLTAGAEQLLLEYGAIHRGRPLVDGGKADEPPAPKWFVHGFSTWLGAFEVSRDRLEAPTGADVLHERIRLDCVAESRGDRDMAEKWTLTELMKPLHVGDGITSGERLSPGYGGKMTSFFECRAWAFCHFLWNYDGGRYRKQFTDFLGLYLDGHATSEKFAVDIMKRPNARDWGDVEKEFEWYWNKLLERKVGQTKITHTWATPTTTPPEGTVEQDEEFLAYWKEHTGK